MNSGSVASLEPRQSRFNSAQYPTEQEGNQNGHCFKCVKKTKVCGLGVLSLLAIVSGGVILPVVTPFAIEKYNSENYGLMTLLVLADLGGLSLVIAGAWKIVKIFCELRRANQMYPTEV